MQNEPQLTYDPKCDACNRFGGAGTHYHQGVSKDGALKPVITELYSNDDFLADTISKVLYRMLVLSYIIGLITILLVMITIKVFFL